MPGRVEGVDLLLRQGEVVGLTGHRSSGVQEIAGALTGELPALSDELVLHGEPRSLGSSADGAALLVVSSELPELLHICHRIGVVSGGRLRHVVDNDARLTEERLIALAAREDKP